MNSDFKALFSDAIRAFGLTPPPEIIDDGVIHRFPTSSKAGDDAGWYILHGDNLPAGEFGCWRSGIRRKWSAKGVSEMSAEERRYHQARMESIKKQRAQEELVRHAEAREKASSRWEAALPAQDDHPYLSRKGVKAYELKTLGDTLLIPMKDEAGTLHSLQSISPDGAKLYLTGGRKRDCFHLIGAWPQEHEPLCLCEGYATGATIHEATGFPIAIAFDAGGLEPVAQALRAKFPNTKLIVCADDDHRTDGNPGFAKAKKAATSIGGYLAIPAFSSDRGDKDTDFNDLAAREGLEIVMEQIASALADNPPLKAATEERIIVVDALQFIGMEFPPRANLLSPWLPKQGLCMVYAPRGVGKTHFSLSVANAVATGGNLFGRWEAGEPAGVLFLDGEMPAGSLQERLKSLINGREPAAPLKIVTPDMQPRGMIDLTRAEDQEELEPYLEGISLIIVDNLSTLCRSGKENEGESWLPVQEWALRQRASGRSVLFIHHAGKDGRQRGSSRREDVLDTVIALKHPSGYTPDQGAVFEVHFEKSRGIMGQDG